MKETRKTFLLRINPALFKELEIWASEDLRSLNGQIEFLLREALRQRKKKTTPEDEEPTPPHKRPT